MVKKSLIRPPEIFIGLDLHLECSVKFLSMLGKFFQHQFNFCTYHMGNFALCGAC